MLSYETLVKQMRYWTIRSGEGNERSENRGRMTRNVRRRARSIVPRRKFSIITTRLDNWQFRLRRFTFHCISVSECGNMDETWRTRGLTLDPHKRVHLVESLHQLTRCSPLPFRHRLPSPVSNPPERLLWIGRSLQMVRCVVAARAHRSSDRVTKRRAITHATIIPARDTSSGSHRDVSVRETSLAKSFNLRSLQAYDLEVIFTVRITENSENYWEYTRRSNLRARSCDRGDSPRRSARRSLSGFFRIIAYLFDRSLDRAYCRRVKVRRLKVRIQDWMVPFQSRHTIINSVRGERHWITNFTGEPS